MFYTILQQISDFRRPQARKYELHNVLFISVLAIICNAKSYRDIATFAKVHHKLIKKRLSHKWKKPPAYTTIRNIIQGVDKVELEKAFRLFAQKLSELDEGETIAIDGKTVRGSFDKFNDQNPIQVLSAMMINNSIVLGHEFFTKDKTNEIPKLVKLLGELSIEFKIITADAMHCQKKR